MTGMPPLDDLMSRDVQPWMPHKEPDQPHGISGTVVKVSATTSDYNASVVPVVELVPDNDDKIIWRVMGFGTVLKRELAEQRPLQGDRIGFRYEGMAGRAKDDYPKFRVVVQRAEQPQPQIDWESIERAAREESDDEPPEEEEPFE
jgi:hypothetical protein